MAFSGLTATFVFWQFQSLVQMNEDIHVLRGKIIQDFLSTKAALSSGFYPRPAILKAEKALVGHVGSMGRNLKQR